MIVHTNPLTATHNTVEQQAVSGAQAQGFALAQSVVAYTQAHSHEWKRFVAKLIELSTAAREEFRKELRRVDKGYVAACKAANGADTIKDAHPVYKGARSSALVRMSQLTTISKALDAGMVVTCKRNPDNDVELRDAGGFLQPVESFDAIYGFAKVFTKTEGKGPGRPVKPLVERIKADTQAWRDNDGKGATPEMLAEAAAWLAATADAISKGAGIPAAK